MFNSDFRITSREWRRDIKVEICLICSRIDENNEFMA